MLAKDIKAIVFEKKALVASPQKYITVKSGAKSYYLLNDSVLGPQDAANMGWTGTNLPCGGAIILGNEVYYSAAFPNGDGETATMVLFKANDPCITLGGGN